MKKFFLKLLLISIVIGDMLYGALTKTEVSELYVALFNRASEGEGNSYWQTNQPDLIKTADVMLNTSDSKEYFGSSLDTNQAFIEHIYKNTLNKTIDDDPKGIEYWTDELNSGKSRAEIVIALINAIKTYKESTGKTKEAYDQFMNRVKISNYMADRVYKVPSDYKISTSFDNGLPVTFDISSFTNAVELVDLLREDAIDNITITDTNIESIFNGDSTNSVNSQDENRENNITNGNQESTISSYNSSESGDRENNVTNRDEESTLNSSNNSVNSESNNREKNVTIVADAGEDQDVTFGENVYFDASGSRSSNGEIVSYTWKYSFYEYTTKEPKKVVSSSKLQIGTFEITLIVTDEVGATATDTVTITIHK